jgi:probable type I restriction-modification system
MREMKDSGIEWIGAIPADWTLQRGKTIFVQRLTKGNQSEILLAATQKYGMLPQSKIEGVVQVKEDADLQQFRTVHKKDFVISLRSFQGGFEYSQYEGVCSPAYQVFYNITPICHNYYRLLFKSDGFIQKMNSMTVGIREGKNIQYSDFANSLIPVPPIDQQHRIANYLDRKCSQIDAIIAQQQEVIEKLKAYKLSVITEVVTKGLNPNVPMKDSGVEWIGAIPEHWENRKMISILSMRVVDGPHESPELYDEGIPYISATAIENGKINFDLMRGYISKEYCDICDLRYKPQLHDILVIKLGASTGQVAIVETTDRFNIWVPLAAVRCNEKANPYFVYYAFQSDYFLKQMEMTWTYGTQQTLGVKSIERLRIMLPTWEEQKEIVSYLKSKCDSIDAAVKNKENLINKLADYKKSLIYEVVTGKKEV